MFNMYVNVLSWQDIQWHYRATQNRYVSNLWQQNWIFHCFVAGTTIHTEEGEVPIESISVGDKILTYQPRDMALVYDTVTEIKTPTHTNFVKYTFDNTTLTATPDHPIFSINHKGWCSYDPESSVANYGITKNTCQKVQPGDTFYSCFGVDEAGNTLLKSSTLISIEEIVEEQVSYTLFTATEDTYNGNFFAGNIMAHQEKLTTFGIPAPPM